MNESVTSEVILRGAEEKRIKNAKLKSENYLQVQNLELLSEREREKEGAAAESHFQLRNRARFAFERERGRV